MAIPAERMKMRKPHIVPLSSQAVAILKASFTPSPEVERIFFLTEQREKAHSLFHTVTGIACPGIRQGGYVHSWLPVYSLNPRSMNRAFDPDWIETATGSQGKATRPGIAYNHAQYLPQRHHMMQAWADFLDSLREDAQKDTEVL